MALADARGRVAFRLRDGADRRVEFILVDLFRSRVERRGRVGVSPGSGALGELRGGETQGPRDQYFFGRR